MKLGAVIVSYNSVGELPACLAAAAVYASDFSEGVLVVDNASTDGSAAAVRAIGGVRLIANPSNFGFASAVNQGFDELSEAHAILLLNPDAHIATSPLLLAEELEDPHVAAASGQLIGEDGKPQIGFQFRRFPTPSALAFEILGLNRLWSSNPVNRRWRALDSDTSQPADVQQPAGACLLIRRQAWAALNGFDEGFFPLWFEDVDFLFRLYVAGWRVRYNPHFRAGHSGGHSVAKISWRHRQLYWYGSLLRFAARHFGLVGRWIICWAVILGLVPRLVMGIITERSTQVVGVCVRLMRLAFWYLSRGDPGEGPLRTRRRIAVEDCGPFGS